MKKQNHNITWNGMACHYVWLFSLLIHGITLYLCQQYYVYAMKLKLKTLSTLYKKKSNLCVWLKSAKAIEAHNYTILWQNYQQTFEIVEKRRKGGGERCWSCRCLWSHRVNIKLQRKWCSNVSIDSAQNDEVLWWIIIVTYFTFDAIYLHKWTHIKESVHRFYIPYHAIPCHATLCFLPFLLTFVMY